MQTQTDGFHVAWIVIVLFWCAVIVWGVMRGDE